MRFKSIQLVLAVADSSRLPAPSSPSPLGGKRGSLDGGRKANLAPQSSMSLPLSSLAWASFPRPPLLFEATSRDFQVSANFYIMGMHHDLSFVVVVVVL